MNRLEKAAHSLGLTKQAFVQETVLARIAEVEEFNQLRKSDPARSTTASSRRSAPQQDGLGLADRYLQRQETVSAVQEVAPTQSPVVVNVGTSAAGAPGAPTNVIDHLALFVVNGDEFTRDMRLRQAVAILHSSATSDEERRALGAKLDEAIAVRLKTSPQADNSVVRTARIAFDKLSSMLKGE